MIGSSIGTTGQDRAVPEIFCGNRKWIWPILETARGGLLRRGLGVTRADVALITNIAEDHLGDFGSQKPE